MNDGSLMDVTALKRNARNRIEACNAWKVERKRKIWNSFITFYVYAR